MIRLPRALCCEYVLTFQVSDYFSFEDLEIEDTISDGQHVLPASVFVPTLQVNGNPYALGASAFNATNYDIACDYTGAAVGPPEECTSLTAGASGQTVLTFLVSNEIITRGQNGTDAGWMCQPGRGFILPLRPFQFRRWANDCNCHFQSPGP